MEAEENPFVRFIVDNYSYLKGISTGYAKRIGLQEVGEDLYHDACIKAMGRTLENNSEEMFRRYFLKIFFHNCIDYLRRRKRTTFLQENTDDEHPLPRISKIVSDDVGPLESLMEEEERGLIHLAIKRLRGRERDFVIAAYFKGASHSKIAETKSLCRDTVVKVIRKARRKIGNFKPLRSIYEYEKIPA